MMMVVHGRFSPNTYCFVHRLNGHLCHNPFVPRTYTSHRRDYCRYCNGWGWLGDTTSIFIHRSYIFLHPYEGGFGRIQHPMAQTNASQTLHNNQMGQECGFYTGITGGRRLFEALCPIFIILVHQKWGDCFTYFGIDGTLLNAWDDTTINKPTWDVYRWGL